MDYSPKITSLQRLLLLFYRGALPLSCPTLNCTAGLIRGHRQKIGSKGRLLNPTQQALLVLVSLCEGDTFAELAAAFAVSTATAWRYVNETVELLAPVLPYSIRRCGRPSRPGTPTWSWTAC